MAQGKCHPRLALGDWNAGDGVGGSQPCGTTRWRDRTLKCHFVEMRAPVAKKNRAGPAARESAAFVSWSWRAPSPRVRRGKSRPAFPSLGGPGRSKECAEAQIAPTNWTRPGLNSPIAADKPVCPFIAEPSSALAPKNFAHPWTTSRWGGEKICEPLSASSTRRRGDANARVDGGNRRRGRNWPDLVDRRDVQLGPRGRLGNEFGRNIAACWVTGHWLNCTWATSDAAPPWIDV